LDAAREIETALRLSRHPATSIALRKGSRSFSRGAMVMGVLNVTPDSFSDGGRFASPRRALDRARQMIEEGAHVIDVGGESTRPGSRPVSLEEELRRVLPVLEGLMDRLRRIRGVRPLVSIDTTKAEVARRAASLGVDMVNDISGLSFDPAMPAVVAESGLPVVIQHIKGRPRTMQRSTRYAHLIPEIASVLRRRVARAIAAGVRADRIVIDPGLGFGKRRHHNLAILRHLSAFRSLGHPILIGASRKSFIGGALELPVSERLEGSLAAEALAIAGGADIIRSHDVREAVRVARLCHAVLPGRGR
jgi:dihydropteroate synthase